MNRLDLAIVRELHRDPNNPLIGIDPLISATHLADRLGVSRNTVRIRMAAWRKEGFLVHQVAIPNPDLFGARLTGLMLRAEEPAAKARLQEAIQMADNVVCSTEMGPFVWTVYLERYATAMDRWKRYLSKLEGVRIEGAPTPIPLPPCSRALTRLDWRLIEAVQTLDRPHTGELARRLGVNRRTVTRHFQALIVANALFVYPIWDFAQTSGAIPFLSVRMAPDANSEMVRETISKLFPAQVPVSPAIPAFIGSDGALGNGSSKQYGFLLYLDAAAKVDEVATIIRQVRGVNKVIVGFPSRTQDHPHCFDSMMSSISAILRSSQTMLGSRGNTPDRFGNGHSRTGRAEAKGPGRRRAAKIPGPARQPVWLDPQNGSEEPLDDPADVTAISRRPGRGRPRAARASHAPDEWPE
jgi:DNA-binding Lrp family transcriptional regulator